MHCTSAFFELYTKQKIKCFMFPEKNGGSEKCWISLLRKQWKSIVQNKFSNVCISCTSSLCIFFTFNICMFCLSCRLSCNFDNSIVILVASDIPVVPISNTLMLCQEVAESPKCCGISHSQLRSFRNLRAVWRQQSL